MFDLNDDVVFEFSVKRMEIIVGGFGAIVFEIAPVEMMVVNECAIEDDTVVRFERASDDIGGVGWSPMVERGAELAFGIGFDDEAAEIGNCCVERVNFPSPPFGDFGIERIECVESAGRLWAA